MKKETRQGWNKGAIVTVGIAVLGIAAGADWSDRFGGAALLSCAVTFALAFTVETRCGVRKDTMRKSCVTITGGVLLGCKKHRFTKPVVWCRYFGMRKLTAHFGIVQAVIENSEAPLTPVRRTVSQQTTTSLVESPWIQRHPGGNGWRQETQLVCAVVACVAGVVSAIAAVLVT